MAAVFAAAGGSIQIVLLLFFERLLNAGGDAQTADTTSATAILPPPRPSESFGSTVNPYTQNATSVRVDTLGTGILRVRFKYLDQNESLVVSSFTRSVSYS